VIVGVGIIIIAILVYLYQRKTKQGPFLLSGPSSSETPWSVAWDLFREERSLFF
jgi:hypothetical protein